jgi:hypothetical protein
MENMDILDKRTPTGADRIDIVPPPVVLGHYGQPQELSYTEKVRGSSPFAKHPLGLRPQAKDLTGFPNLSGLY